MEMCKLDKNFRTLWKNYVLQSFLATLAMSIVLMFLSIEHAVIVASIGATSFIVFAMPRSVTARPRNVIGGHMIGLLCGSVSTLIPHPPSINVIMYSIAVGLSIFLMIITNTEHPPASGTALGVAINGFHPNVALAVIVSAVTLSAIHYSLRKYLKDLV